MTTLQIVVEMALVLFVVLSVLYAGTYTLRHFQNREEVEEKVNPFGETLVQIFYRAGKTVRLAVRKVRPSWLEKREDEFLSPSDEDFLRVLELEARVAYIWATTDVETIEESLERDFCDRF